MKIAPTLRWHIQVPFTTVRKVMVDDTPKMAAELRALLAVAKAATKERAAVLEVARYARGTHKGEIDGDYIGRMLEDSDERLACALARLERVSKEKP